LLPTGLGGAAGVVAGLVFAAGLGAAFVAVFAGVAGRGVGVRAGVEAGVVAGVAGVVFDGGGVVAVFAGTSVFAAGNEEAAGTSVEIAPLVQIRSRLSLFISNSIVLRRGTKG
jgi:hypothetical protein